MALSTTQNPLSKINLQAKSIKKNDFENSN